MQFFSKFKFLNFEKNYNRNASKVLLREDVVTATIILIIVTIINVIIIVTAATTIIIRRRIKSFPMLAFHNYK